MKPLRSPIPDVATIHVARHVDPPPQATERYADLVNDLGVELHKKHGWKAAVARALGAHPAHITRLLQGERSIGWEVMDRAASALHIHSDYFLQTEPTHYSKWRVIKPAASSGEGGSDQAILSIVESFSQLTAGEKVRVLAILEKLK